jgi:hypothetical protein
MIELGPAAAALGLHKANLDGTKWVGRCGVHGGDNPKALVIWLDEPTQDISQAKSGRWFCTTRHCGSDGLRLIGKGRLYLPGEADMDTLAMIPSGPYVPPPPRSDIPGRYEEILEAAFSLYRKHYVNSPGFRYLRAREINPVEAGYALGQKFLLNRGLPRQELIDVGLIWGEVTMAGKPVAKWRVGRDRLEGRVILPYRWHGHLTCLYGRSVDLDYALHRTATEKEGLHHLYTSCRTGDAEWDKGVYNEPALDASHLMVVEAAICASAAERRPGRILRLAGEQNGYVVSDRKIKEIGRLPVCAIGGTFNRVVIERLRGRHVLLGHDNDEPGDLAAQAMAQELREESTRVRPPEPFKDWSAWNTALGERSRPGVQRVSTPADAGSRSGVG